MDRKCGWSGMRGSRSASPVHPCHRPLRIDELSRTRRQNNGQEPFGPERGGCSVGWRDIWWGHDAGMSRSPWVHLLGHGRPRGVLCSFRVRHWSGLVSQANDKGRTPNSPNCSFSSSCLPSSPSSEHAKGEKHTRPPRTLRNLNPREREEEVTHIKKSEDDQKRNGQRRTRFETRRAAVFGTLSTPNPRDT